MDIPVLLEPTTGNGFRARSGEPLVLTAEGATRELALEQLRNLIHGRVAAGAEIVTLHLASTTHPWAPFAGDLQDDPMLEEWKDAMAQYRKDRDAE